ncbi:hypothetical protein BDZ97DRAFT_1768157 [Flammula alnicola]|nr:hypothetical protein BDZ97DRAFT_1768157 [Flammula alnicola]
MTPTEKAQFDAERRGSLPNASQRSWMNTGKEMGLVSVMITAYTLPDGKLVIDAHDEIADLMGIPARSLIDSHPEEISKMKLLLMDYMKTLRNKVQVPVVGGTDTNPGTQKVLLTTTSEGYPILPEPWRNGDESKKKLEELFSLYIGRHYKLATNGRTMHPPYAAIMENHGAFFSPEYLPPSFTVKHPRNLTKMALEAFFDHIEERQKDHGPKGAFRFKSIKHGETLLPAKYPTSASDGDADAGAGAGGRRKARTKNPKLARRQLNEIHAAGFPMPFPVNGPADGLPKYAIDPTTYRAYEQLQDANNRHTNPTNSHPNIDPALLHPPPAPMPTPAATPAPETLPAHPSAHARLPRQAGGRTMPPSTAPAATVTAAAIPMLATPTAPPAPTQGRRVRMTRASAPVPAAAPSSASNNGATRNTRSQARKQPDPVSTQKRPRMTADALAREEATSALTPRSRRKTRKG